jgi:hypothetical protein
VTDHLPVDAVMTEIRARVRARVLEDLSRTSPGSPLLAPGVFDGADAIFRRALDARRHLVVPDLLLDEEDWELSTRLDFTSHRPVTGSLILFLKRRVLLPLTRWLFEYSRDNFARQARVNATLMACVETLVVEVVQLRRELDAARGSPAPDGRAGSPP